MDIKLQELSSDTTIVKHYIKDLSFENLCNINNQDLKKDEVKISDNISVVFQAYNDDNFSVLFKYSCDCLLVENEKRVFILEIDYFGLFKKNNMSNYSNDDLAKVGCIILYPIIKPIIEYIAQNGAPINITLTEPDLNLIKA
jgi:preprotein translocase subunit SecB